MAEVKHEDDFFALPDSSYDVAKLTDYYAKATKASQRMLPTEKRPYVMYLTEYLEAAFSSDTRYERAQPSPLRFVTEPSRNYKTVLLADRWINGSNKTVVVGVKGLEPSTSRSQTARATNCATPRKVFLGNYTLNGTCFLEAMIQYFV